MFPRSLVANDLGEKNICAPTFTSEDLFKERGSPVLFHSGYFERGGDLQFSMTPDSLLISAVHGRASDAHRN